MKTFLLAALLLCIAESKAQDKTTTSLKVLLVPPKNDSGSNATIQLLSLPDSAIISTQVFSKTGNRFTVHTFSKYLISVSAIGIEPVSKIINVSNTPVNVTLSLKRSTTNMQNVVVVSSRRPLVKQEDDKTVVDATALSNSSTNAYEVLEKTPGVIVDQDGNVYLGSLQAATVFINGREMKLSAADLASLLKSLPAGSISKIEILRNPSAKFDAASSGGIVNIVLKKGVKLGSNGSANLAYFQGVYNTVTGGVNVNNSMGKVNTYFSYQYTSRKNYETLNSLRLIKTDTSALSQNAYTTYPSANHYIGTGLDIGFTKKFSAAYDTRISSSSNQSDALNAINIIKTASQADIGNNQSAIYNSTHSTYWSNSLSSKYKIDSLGSEWTTELDYNYFNSSNAQDYTNAYFLPAKPAVLGNGENKNDKNIFAAQTDLVYKQWKWFTLESGFKLTSSTSKNSSLYYYQTGALPRQVDSFQTNTFKYKETITAAYLQLSKTLWGFTLKPGLRLETTNIDGRQTVPKDTSLYIKRTDLFPYVYLRHKLFTLFKTDLIGSAIYRRSIRRPYYEILNPYPKYVDQYLYDVGNPKLQPQFTTNYEFNVMFQDFPVFAVGVNETKNIFSNVTYQDDVTRIAYRTYDNLGRNKEFYFRMIAGIPPGGKYFFYMGAQYNHNQYNGLYQNLPFSYSRGSWLFFMYQELKATPTLSFSTQGFMRTKALQNFYELNTFGGLFVSVNKSVLKKKANIIFSVNDLLQTNHVTFALNQGNVNTTGTRINDTRRLGITLRYNFGISKPKEKKEFGAAPNESGN
ncbi:MAG: outer membrane beta-barrel protein [Bacteroidetes bacterium]|nr:outer membrane beta-barrel protein [Bacteroidota bacterium]